MKSNYIKEKQTLEQEITELLENQKLYTPSFSVSEKVHSVIQNYLSIKVLSVDLINTFIDRITVLDREHIQIKYTFQEEMDCLLKTIHSREKAGE
ncbi:MAG: hypothetical protein LUG99_22505 [Lachnospiraceae bacterium]|nr:hypothetical protein [Lachnospiraceae bacterium]